MKPSFFGERNPKEIFSILIEVTLSSEFPGHEFLYKTQLHCLFLSCPFNIHVPYVFILVS